MICSSRIQTNRRELKYLVSEPCAAAIRDYIGCHLRRDEFADPKSNSYAIYSLYLDGPSLSLWEATVRGLKNRLKLRVRFYDEVPSHPVFFEIKRRVNDAVVKERAAVLRAAAPRLLAGHWPERSDLVHPDPKSLASLQRFCELRDTVRAAGRVFVGYDREAYVSPNDHNVRVTFDRRVTAGLYCHDLSWSRAEGLIHPHVGGVVLELKFTDRFPRWMSELTQIFDLQRRSVAKYAICVDVLGLGAVRAGRPRRIG